MTSLNSKYLKKKLWCWNEFAKSDGTTLGLAILFESFLLVENRYERWWLAAANLGAKGKTIVAKIYHGLKIVVKLKPNKQKYLKNWL